MLVQLAKAAAVVSISVAAQGAYALEIGEIEPNDRIDIAQNVDASFSTGFVQNIESGEFTNDSATVPHVTINGTGDDTFDIFSFTVSEPNSMGIFDIDNGEINGLDSFLRLFDTDANGNTLLAFNDDSAFDGPGDQLAFTLNSFLTWTFASTGLYYIEVGSFNNGLPAQEVPPGTAYQLHISIAEPVPEPGTLALFAAGILGAGLSRRRRA